jgi:DNA-binding NarL/FixJ family response regulator
MTAANTPNANRRYWRAALSPAEAVVVERAAQGHSSPKIAAELHLSLSTVKFHIAAAFRKLNVDSRVTLARWWIYNVELPEEIDENDEKDRKGGTDERPWRPIG